MFTAYSTDVYNEMDRKEFIQLLKDNEKEYKELVKRSNVKAVLLVEKDVAIKELTEENKRLKEKLSISKNLLPEVCKMLGVEIEENFHLSTSDDSLYKIREDGCLMRLKTNVDGSKKWGYATDIVGGVGTLLTGKTVIAKTPFEPKLNESYFTVVGCSDGLNPCTCWQVVKTKWVNNTGDVLRLKVGWIYRTEEEALKALSKLSRECGVGADMRGLSAFENNEEEDEIDY